VDLEEAVVASTDAQGKVKLHTAVNLTADRVLADGSWGALIGLILVCPFAGFAVRAATMARSGALADIGISDTFMKDLAATMAPGSSTLFILVKQATPDKVLEELTGTGGRVLKTSLSHEDEAKLQAVLRASRE